MKTTKLTNEQLEQMSYADVANLVLTETGKKMNIQDLFKNVLKLMELPDSYFESKIADFFALLSTDKRFIMLEKGNWDLRINHSSKITIADEDDEEEEEIEEKSEDDVENMDEDIENEEINYDDEETVDDDEEEDQYKDLVIMDEGEAEEM